MKKNTVRLTAVLLCAVMTFSLCACSGRRCAEPEAPAPEYGYVPERFHICTGTDLFMARCFTSKGCYLTAWEKVGNNAPEDTEEELLEQFDVYETRIYYFEPGRELERLEEYKPLPRAENVNDWSDFYSNSDICCLSVLDDGRIVTIESVYVSGFSGPEGIGWDDPDYAIYDMYYTDWYIRLLNPDGSELSCSHIDSKAWDYFYGSSALLDKDGYLVSPNSDRLIAIGADGRVAYVCDAGGVIDGVFRLSDGRIGALVWEDEKVIRVLDPETHEFTDSFPVSASVGGVSAGGGEYDFCYTDSVSFFGFNMSDGNASCLFDWLSCDVNPTDIGLTDVDSDGTVRAVCSVWDSSSMSYSIDLIRVAYAEIPPESQSKTITLGTCCLDFPLQSMVADFNRSEAGVKIKIIDYGTDETGVSNFKAALKAGNVPDIIDLNGLNCFALASDGIIVDLYPFLESDPELDRAAFFPNILALREYEGMLLSTVPGFYVNTVMCSPETARGRTSWSYSELNEALSRMPGGCEAFENYMTAPEMFTRLMSIDFCLFCDRAAGTVNLDCEGFRQLLEFCAAFPTDFDWQHYSWSDDDAADYRVMNGLQMLLQTGVYGFEDAMYNGYQFTDGTAVYIGYPTSSGTGHAVGLEPGFAMSTSCGNKDAAWLFLRTFFTEEYQSSHWHFPSRISLFNTLLNEAATPNFIYDEDGEIALDDDGNMLQYSQGSVGLSDGSIVQIYAMTQAEVNSLLKLVNTASKEKLTDTVLLDLLLGSVAAYFDGSMTLDEAVATAQDNVSAYLAAER